jgi:hypothetical protein
MIYINYHGHFLSKIVTPDSLYYFALIQNGWSDEMVLNILAPNHADSFLLA